MRNVPTPIRGRPVPVPVERGRQRQLCWTKCFCTRKAQLPLARQPCPRGRHHVQVAVGYREEVLRHDGRCAGRHEPRAGREAATGHAELDAAHPRDSCASARRADSGTRQPAARVPIDNLHVPSFGRSSPGEADWRGVRGASGMSGRVVGARQSAAETHGPARGGFASACRS